MIPGGYAHEHVTHYTHASLMKLLGEHGFVHEESAYIARSELIMRCRKTQGGAKLQAPVGPRDTGELSPRAAAI